jgi:predicted DNA-binding transcriptional regulator AlpA
MADLPLSRRKLRTPEAASYCGLSARTLEKYRVSGGGPPYYKLSAHAVVYDLADLDAWLAARRCTSTSDARGHLSN